MTINRKKLEQIFEGMEQCTIAVSGGVDSMTLAAVANNILGRKALIVHAVSAAVPREASQRVREFSKKYDWNLLEINAREIEDINYQKNPVDRCYYCKGNLYGSIAKLGIFPILSGTNMDDLGDYRPGLIAAKEHNIRHPFVEAKIDKAELREISKELGFVNLSSLPASPCLSSRIETGVVILPAYLTLIDTAERQLRTMINAENIRCRVLAERVVVQVDKCVLNEMEENALLNIKEKVGKIAKMLGMPMPVDVAPYVRGSAFVRVS